MAGFLTHFPPANRVDKEYRVRIVQDIMDLSQHLVYAHCACTIHTLPVIPGLGWRARAGRGRAGSGLDYG